jgi:hypothetical protein
MEQSVKLFTRAWIRKLPGAIFCVKNPIEQEAIKMKTYSITIEVSWESTNGEIAEREVIRDLNRIWEPGDYIVHVDDDELFYKYLDAEGDVQHG